MFAAAARSCSDRILPVLPADYARTLAPQSFHVMRLRKKLSFGVGVHITSLRAP